MRRCVRKNARRARRARKGCLLRRGTGRQKPCGFGDALGHHAAGVFAAFARVGGGFRLSVDVSGDFVFVLAVFAAAASFVVIAANHPRFGVAGGEESEGDESEEPFHNGSEVVWRVRTVVVKRNPTGAAVSFCRRLGSNSHRLLVWVDHSRGQSADECKQDACPTWVMAG